MKKILTSKGGWSGFFVMLWLLLSAMHLENSIIEIIFQSISRFIIDIICPTGGLMCLGWGIPLLLSYLIVGFVIGYLIEKWIGKIS